MKAQVSLYNKITETKNSVTISIQDFVNGIEQGTWQDYVLEVRTGKRTKKEVPYITASGVFSERKNDCLVKHSNFIAIDFDNVDNIDEVKNVLANDKYSYFVFTSISGKGLCVLVKIDGKKHLDAFRGLQSYYFETYGYIIDNSCKDLARARLVSYDPDAKLNENSELFDLYPARKEIKHEKIEFVPHLDSDIDFIIEQIQKKNLNLCNNYEEWIHIGFALADKFGANGYEYFRIISQISGMYRPDSQANRPEMVRKQWENCLKSSRSGITIKTFFYYAKRAGCELQSQKTKDAIKYAYYAKKRNQKPEQVIEYLPKSVDITEQEAKIITEQVYSNDVNVKLTPQEVVLDYLKQNHSIRYNTIKDCLEIDNKRADTHIKNTIYLEVFKIQNISYEFFERVLYSNYFEQYNPLQEYFNKLKTFDFKSGVIKEVLECFEPENKDFFDNILIKWLVGLVGGGYGKPCNFAIVLISPKMRIGKTTFFRTLLPPDLQDYFAELNFDNPNAKDDLIPLTKNLLVLADEWQDVNKRSPKRLRWIITAKDFDIRKAYRRDEDKYARIATIAGTSNAQDIIVEGEFNRRVIPLGIKNMDLQKWLDIDKDELFAELHQLFIAGFNYEIGNADFEKLQEIQTEYQEVSKEEELIIKHIAPSDDKDDFCTTTEITATLQALYPKMNLYPVPIGKTLNKLGHKRIQKKVNGVPIHGYLCKILLPTQNK